MAAKYCETCDLHFGSQDLADAHFKANPFHDKPKPLSRWAFGVTVDQSLYSALCAHFPEETPIGFHIREVLASKRNRVEFAVHKDDLNPLALAAYEHKLDKSWPKAIELFNAISQTLYD